MSIYTDKEIIGYVGEENLLEIKQIIKDFVIRKSTVYILSLMLESGIKTDYYSRYKTIKSKYSKSNTIKYEIIFGEEEGKKFALKLNREKSSRCYEFWVKQGYLLEDAKKQASFIQSNSIENIMKKRNITKAEAKELHKKWGAQGNATLKKNHSEEELRSIYNSRSSSLENYTRIYGEDEGKERFDARVKKYKHSCTLDGYVDKYGEKDGIVKYNTEYLNPERFFTKDEYWIKNGLDMSKKKQFLSDRVSFSLSMCLDRYGEDEGRKIFKERQNLWQETINAKTDEEKLRINQSKSSGAMSGLFNSNPKIKGIPGILYYIRFYNSNTEFWKIGITSRTINERFGLEKNMEAKTNLHREIIYTIDDMSFYDCFKEEQRILNEHKEKRITVDYNGFRSTECFSEDILKTKKEKYDKD